MLLMTPSFWLLSLYVISESKDEDEDLCVKNPSVAGKIIIIFFIIIIRVKNIINPDLLMHM